MLRLRLAHIRDEHGDLDEGRHGGFAPRYLCHEWYATECASDPRDIRANAEHEHTPSHFRKDANFKVWAEPPVKE